ncbi:molybdopterin-dependent oxidoreductase [Nitratireductor sp. ZSWI3]|uniref:molybdopterin-dependent oxidoreductase n=1 Tax=Nitratireductor sp. ZSWI3 TaxID=2966359 RepID=UPI00214FF3F9|nr:molybdopterin-dependent oxidoreductase [Nitratireductor sp. ZSWI3]MCR4265888.1 molybdopterin-dependent oxidoreductase [Nitratireductor sp. ZSWI3]
MGVRRRTSLSHWGAFEATVEDGRLVAARPWADGGADPQMIGVWPDLVYSESRIDRPHVREGFLRDRERAGGEGRGRERMVAVDWDTALALVAEQLQRVHAEHGAASVFGGSYGWSSAGRFHHARTQIRRFLAAAGGFTDQVGNYSWGAANAILPHILGDAEAVSGAATGWETIAAESDVVVAFGGLNPKNWRVTSGGAGHHHMPRHIAEARRRGVKFIIVSPFAGDCPEGLDATFVAPRPNTDTAIMLALAHQALVEGRPDLSFLERYTEGHEAFLDYLRGAADGVPKTLSWAAGLCDVPEAELSALWRTIRQGRVMLTASWSLQRADHGEQPFWALIALAAMLGQIGLPGGGFCFGYGSLNGVGAAARRGFVPAMEGLPNPAGSAVPVASFIEAFLNPGGQIPFNGRTVVFPDVRLVYWAGGNPFHHAQDLFKLEAAWRRPEAIIVHEPWWTSTARRADIVLPATTSAERNDLGGSSRDPFVFAMPKLIEPLAEARDDFVIFRDLADRLGCRTVFDEGLDEMQWLRRLWAKTQARGGRAGLDIPSFETFWKDGLWAVPAPDAPEVLLEAYRRDPEAHPLKTPSGRIELFSRVIAGFAYADAPPHAVWREPREWLGAARDGELHLVTNQPEKRLHSQLYQTRRKNAPETVEINRRDAEARGIGDGDVVRLWNERGACLAIARVGERVRHGVLVMPTGAWFEPDEQAERLEVNGNPNVLTADRRTSALGQACAALSALVRIEPYRRDESKSEAD